MSTVLERSLPVLFFSLSYPFRFRTSAYPSSDRPTRVSCATTRCFFVFVQNRAANVGTNCMPSRACHSCILCTDRTLCRSAPGLNLCLMARYEARSCISRQSDRDSPLRARRIPSDSWNAPFALRHPPDNICISCPCENLPRFIFHLFQKSFVIEGTPFPCSANRYSISSCFAD